jgi:ORF6N domain
MSKHVISTYRIAERILYLREQKVILDRDLARLYGVQTRVLNQAVTPNSDRRPSHFAFILSRRNLKDITVCDILFDPKFSKQVGVFTEQAVTALSRGRSDE